MIDIESIMHTDEKTKENVLETCGPTTYRVQAQELFLSMDKYGNSFLIQSCI